MDLYYVCKFKLQNSRTISADIRQLPNRKKVLLATPDFTQKTRGTRLQVSRLLDALQDTPFTLMRRTTNASIFLTVYHKQAHSHDRQLRHLLISCRIWNNASSARHFRADTPFTSPPLPDDFDAITQRWSRTTRVTTVEPTASGLLDRLEAATRTTTPAVAAFPNSRRRKNDGNVEIHQNEKLVAAQEKTLRRTRRDDRIKASGVNDRTRMGPLAGQDYEMVRYHVLEEGPDCTVSISTWREQAIEEADSDQDMSVYFVEPDDYIPLGTSAAVEIMSIMAEANLASGSGERNKGAREPSGKLGAAKASKSSICKGCVLINNVPKLESIRREVKHKST
ncbi:hypothetical protein B0H12DRAFT_232747 [Mycena haematopus]|nr:hypothetical protein B0H12DRAFT_232747 [Mycena haematopus]